MMNVKPRGMFSSGVSAFYNTSRDFHQDLFLLRVGCAHYVLCGSVYSGRGVTR